ncbi:CRAL-TRIO domain-containing protein C3H8.02 isoform X1 [Iris pallida]|uniref:CRAL-TRIO domain-containing protein C3H8.02 isoform X1 n=1 Tax=Iris pallida TaxID=29817 RepID=A0AAX6E5T4_IRIPA|nr:CRAL-TRIO domain-containing protein C3H8.02 isoform X1 [Iris pallida]
MALLSSCHPLRLSPPPPALRSTTKKKPSHYTLKCSAENRTLRSPLYTRHSHLDTRQLVLEVKERLKLKHPGLPVGRNGRDDEDMILWFLKDRNFSVEDAVFKLSKAIKWRKDFGVSELREESVKRLYATGKGYVHDSLDIYSRPVLIVVGSKHFPSKEIIENQKLCVYLVEKAISKLPDGVEDILGIVDLRGFGVQNADGTYLKFLFDLVCHYYPKRLGELLFMEAPFVFQPVWQLVKPLTSSYSTLARFCDAETVRKEYFTKETLPAAFKL